GRPSGSPPRCPSPWPGTSSRHPHSCLLLIPVRPIPTRALQDLLGLPGDDDLLVGRDGPHLHARAGRRDAALDGAGLVERRIELDAEPAEVSTDARADPRRVLADAPGEDDRVGAA